MGGKVGYKKGNDHHGCCGFFGLFGSVLKAVLPNVLPVSLAGIFRGQHSVLWCSWLGSAVFAEMIIN